MQNVQGSVQTAGQPTVDVPFLLRPPIPCQTELELHPPHGIILNANSTYIMVSIPPWSAVSGNDFTFDAFKTGGIQGNWSGNVLFSVGTQISVTSPN